MVNAMAMIRRPFFDVKYPMYMNYGDNGRAIANELKISEI